MYTNTSICILALHRRIKVHAIAHVLVSENFRKLHKMIDCTHIRDIIQYVLGKVRNGIRNEPKYPSPHIHFYRPPSLLPVEYTYMIWYSRKHKLHHSAYHTEVAQTRGGVQWSHIHPFQSVLANSCRQCARGRHKGCLDGLLQSCGVACHLEVTSGNCLQNSDKRRHAHN